jgi:hypothetical protein
MSKDRAMRNGQRWGSDDDDDDDIDVVKARSFTVNKKFVATESAGYNDYTYQQRVLANTAV